MRLKYGVMVEQDFEKEGMTPEVYEKAYLQKLQQLIEKETHVPVAVLLDRYFTSPHLASGTPKQMAEAMWEELEEVRAPVLLVSAWLEKPNDDTLGHLIHPASKESLIELPVGRTEAARELEALTLEDFLGLL